MRGRSFYGNLRLLNGIDRLRTTGKGSNSPLEKGLWDARCIFRVRPYADNKSRNAHRYLYTATALAVFLLGGGETRARAETLRWKLNPGEVLHYALDTKQIANFKVTGRDKKSTRSNTINLSWTVKSVSANGDAEISLEFDRVRMRIEQPPFVPLEFDSSPEQTGDSGRVRIGRPTDQSPRRRRVYVQAPADRRGGSISRFPNKP